MHTKRMMPEFVCDAVNLEGLNFTIPEIQTLLDGINECFYLLTFSKLKDL